MNPEPEKQGGENGAKRSPYKDMEYEQFIEFYALPDEERKKLGYESVSDWCTKNNVHRNTITRWKARQDFKQQVYSRRLDWGNDRMSEVFSSLYKSCVKGNVQAIELWLSYFEGWDKKQVADNPRAESFTQDDIRALLSVLPKERQDFYKSIIRDIVVETQKEMRKSSL
jgi:hypothetical protein